jgi:hypothetical protein
MSNPTDWRALCAELHQCLEYIDRTCDVPIPGTLLDRARTAQAQPEPEGVTLDCDEIDVPAWYRGDDVHVYEEGYTAGWAAGTQAMAHHARPTIQPLAPEPGYEKGYAQEHLARLMRDAIGTETNHNVYIVAAGKILDRPEFAHVARWGTSTIQPVPVAERLPGPEDCDAEGRCWLHGLHLFGGEAAWVFGYPAWAQRFTDVYSHWLPHHALSVPQQEAGQ